MSIVNWPMTAKLLDDYSRTEHVPLNISSLLPLIKNEEFSKFIPLLCLQLILLSVGFGSCLNYHIFLSIKFQTKAVMYNERPKMKRDA